MKSNAVKAFDLDSESKEVRDNYGRNYFGQGCLLARRLVEAGVSFVEVSLGGLEGAPAGWDTAKMATTMPLTTTVIAGHHCSSGGT